MTILYSIELRADGSFGVAIFDNFQNMQYLKFHRFGRSSTVTLTNSRCFLIPVNPVFPSTIIFNNHHVHITYHNQIIPSPHEMPAFESILTIYSNIFGRKISQKMILPLTCQVMVWRLMQNLVMASGSIKWLQRLISFCNDGTFQFHPAVNLTATTSIHVQKN